MIRSILSIFAGFVVWSVIYLGAGQVGQGSVGASSPTRLAGFVERPLDAT